jgi:hypothetical protein
MGNRNASLSIEVRVSSYEKVQHLFEELKQSLMDKFTEDDKGSVAKIDTIAFYGDLRELLIVDEPNKKELVNALVFQFESKYVLNTSEKQLMNAMIASI